MPDYYGKDGKRVMVHHGYEGDKYAERGTLKPINVKKGLKIAGGFLLGSYIYIRATTMIEERNSETSRGKKMDGLDQMRAEMTSEEFTDLLSRGKIGSASPLPHETPQDHKALLERAFPQDFKKEE